MEERCFQASQFTGWDPLERDPRTGRRLLHSVLENHAHRRFLDSREGDRQLALLVQELLNKGCLPGDVFDGQTALELAMARELWTTARILEAVSPPARQTVDQAQLLSELKSGFLEDFLEIEGTKVFRERMEKTASVSDNGATLFHLHAAAFLGSLQDDGYYSGSHGASDKLSAWVERHHDRPDLAGFWALAGLSCLARGHHPSSEDNVLTFARSALLKGLSNTGTHPQKLLLQAAKPSPLHGVDRQRWGATLLGAFAALNVRPALLVEKEGWNVRQVGELGANLLEHGWDAFFGGPVRWEAEDWTRLPFTGRVQWKGETRNVNPMIVQHIQETGNLWTTLGPLDPVLDGLCSIEELSQAPWPVEQHPWLLRLTEGNGTEALLARQCHLAATLAPSSERRPARL